jgi:transketolase
MRDTFQKELLKLAKKRKNLFLLTADLGFGVFEEYQKKFPKQYINVGIAEQNLIGIATGLALEGKIVIAYSIANFLTLRCLEQIRNDAAYHNLNINLVSTGGGYTYGALGMSHHATEDLSVLNAIPNMTIVAPGNKWETKKAINLLIKKKGAKYLRLEKSGNQLKPLDKSFELGKLIKYISGKKIVIISIGGIFTECVKAVKKLNEINIYPAFYSLSSLKPLNKKNIIQELKKYKIVLTVEENNFIGGLGSTFSYLINKNDLRIKHYSLSTEDKTLKIVGDQNFLRKKIGLDSMGIFKKIKKLCNG